LREALAPARYFILGKQDDHKKAVANLELCFKFVDEASYRVCKKICDKFKQDMGIPVPIEDNIPDERAVDVNELAGGETVKLAKLCSSMIDVIKFDDFVVLPGSDAVQLKSFKISLVQQWLGNEFKAIGAVGHALRTHFGHFDSLAAWSTRPSDNTSELIDGKSENVACLICGRTGIGSCPNSSTSEIKLLLCSKWVRPFCNKCMDLLNEGIVIYPLTLKSKFSPNYQMALKAMACNLAIFVLAKASKPCACKLREVRFVCTTCPVALPCCSVDCHRLMVTLIGNVNGCSTHVLESIFRKQAHPVEFDKKITKGMKIGAQSIRALTDDYILSTWDLLKYVDTLSRLADSTYDLTTGAALDLQGPSCRRLSEENSLETESKHLVRNCRLMLQKRIYGE
jgi:hypothetical protein